MAIKLIVGLRNPGDRYAKTRHNVGAWLLDDLAQNLHCSWSLKKDLLGEVTEIQWPNIKVWGLMPTTFMNLSGQSVSAFARYYRIQPEEILVIHDELDLPVGTARLKQGGGHGGHNGLQDIIRHLGQNDFYRLRLGIGHPGDKSLVSQYVLGVPSQADRLKIDEAIANCIPYMSKIVEGDMSQVMNELHRRIV